jgi:ATP synthase protein I
VSEPRDRQTERIVRNAGRKKIARDHPGPSPLRGFGTFGMIGWSVAVPTVGGALLGLWLDRARPQEFSWTIALLLGGLAVGVMIAWAWIEKERGE